MIHTKKSWVVRANIAVGQGDHPLHEEFITRDKARDYKRLLKGMGNWKDVKMYRATEVHTGRDFFYIYLEPVR